MTSEVTQAVTDERSPAQFFFEMGFGACYAEAIVRNGDQAPFPLSDEEMERQWAISREAYDDPAELDAMLARIESTRLTAQSGEGRAAIIEECAAVADGWNPGRKDRVTETGIAAAIRELSGEGRSGAVRRDWVSCPICHEPDMRQEIDAENNRLIFCVNHSCPSNGAIEGRSGAGEDGDEALLADANSWYSSVQICGALIGSTDTTCALPNAHDGVCAALNARQSGEGEREAVNRLARATFALMEFDIHRYLIANVRHNGAEKADNHRALTEAFLRVYAPEWRRRDRDLYTRIHDATQDLTSHLNEIGLGGDTHYDDAIPQRFHDRFIELALAALRATDDAGGAK